MKNIREGEPRVSGRKIWKRVLCVILAVVLIASAFAGGYALRYYTEDEAVRTLRWVKSMVRNFYYREIPEEDLSKADLDDLFGSNDKQPLLDIYSTYYTAEAFAAQQQYQAGSLSGIGLSFLARSDGNTQIYRVTGNSPAEESGLKAGMYVLGYGSGQENIVYGFNQSAFSAYISALPDKEEFVLLASGTADGEGNYYTVYKDSYLQNYVFYSDSQISYRFTGENADELTQGESEAPYLPDDTAYLRFDSFNGEAASQFEGLLKEFRSRGKNRLILDLRNNGGGQMSVLCDIASYLCKDAKDGNFPVSVARYKNEKTEIFNADKNLYDEYFTEDTKIIVLANANTASASEALIGAMIDYGTVDYDDIYLSEIGGVARSYGKGIMQTTYYNVLTGEAVKLTTASVHWPLSDVCIQDRGVLPEDGAVAVTANGFVDYNDQMLRSIIGNHLA